MNAQLSLALIHNLESPIPGAQLCFIDKSWNSLEAESAKFFASPEFTNLIPISVDNVITKSRKLEDEILKYLSPILNEYHQVSFSDNAWKIMLGHWLRAYTQTITYNYQKIETLNQLKRFKRVYVSGERDRTFVPIDTNESIINLEDEYFLESICRDIAESLMVNSEFEFITKLPEVKNYKKQSSLKYRSTLTEKIVDKIQFNLSKLARKYSRNNGPLIVATYLPFSSELKLNLLEKQWPRFQIYDFEIQGLVSQPDAKLRESLFSRDYDKKLELNIALKFLPATLPLSFLENFHAIRNSIAQQKFPTNPKYIFTSNSFMTNETFKIYSAIQSDRRVPYIVGQHGNSYGTLKYLSPTIEEETSTSFLTWGWKNEKSIPSFILKNPHNSKLIYTSKRKKLLLITGHKMSRYWPIDVTDELDQNLEIQTRFIETLDKRVLEKIELRLHPNSWRNNERSLVSESRFIKRDSVNFGNSNIKNLVRSSKIVVHAYDSTGMLETLSSNIPTIGMWSHQFSPKTIEAVEYYELLRKVGIVHKDGMSAATHINAVWNDIDKWWHSDEVQEARAIFCKQYARQIDYPIRSLKKILNSI